MTKLYLKYIYLCQGLYFLYSGHIDSRFHLKIHKYPLTTWIDISEYFPQKTKRASLWKQYLSILTSYISAVLRKKVENSGAFLYVIGKFCNFITYWEISMNSSCVVYIVRVACLHSKE